VRIGEDGYQYTSRLIRSLLAEWLTPPSSHSEFAISSCVTLRSMSNRADSTPTPSLKLLPAYLGTSSIENALATARGRRILWLEILVNDQLDPTPWLENPAFRQAYQIACRWYTQYRGLLTYLFDRAPLPLDAAPIDFRDYRAFAKALYFVAHRDQTRCS